MKRKIFITFLVLSVLNSQAQTIKTYATKDGVESQFFTDCKQDGSGNIWFAGNKGVSKWDGTKFTFIKGKNPKLIQWGYKLLLDRQKNILIYSYYSKNLYKVENDQYIEIGNFEYITSDAEGIVWGVSDKSLFRYDGNQLEKLCSDRNTSLSEPMLDSKGNIWLASGEGIYRIKNKDYVRFSKDYGINSSSVTSIFEDSKGSIWVTTRDSGIFCYSNDKWVPYTKENGLFSNDILQVAEDKKGLIWAAHYKAGISYYDGSKWVEDRKGSGYFLLNPLTKDPYKKLFYSVIQIDSLNNVWFACIGGNILKFNGTEWEKLLHINVGSNGLEIYISKLNNNNIWFKSCDALIYPGIGLNKYDLMTNELTNVSNSNVFEIAESNNGVVWFYTDKGLFKYDDINGYTEVIASKNVQPYSFFYKSNLLFDNIGNVWTGFKDGIYCIPASR
jgi:ligand-binding sensor domain-containing protein